MSSNDRWKFFLASEAAAEISRSSVGHVRKNVEQTRVVDLKVDYIDRPLGLENPRPDFSWRLESGARNVRQSAYRILVSSDEAALEAGRGDLWDSGKVESTECFGIAYQGKALYSRQRCWWRVQVWDSTGRASEPNVCSWWEMGLLAPQDWVAQWLVADDAVAKADRETVLRWMWSRAENDCDEESRQFRCTFSLPEATGGGVLFALIKGFEDGWKVTGAWLDGEPIRVSYPGHDLTRENLPLGRLAAGEHRLAIELRRSTNPWPETFFEVPKPGIACLARFDGTDGRSYRVTSGGQWQTRANAGSHWCQEQHDEKAWVTVATCAIERDSYDHCFVDHDGQVTVDPAMYLRREFAIRKTISTARLYATALGCYEGRLNGKRIGDALLAPEISQYDERLLYRAYDVRELLETGANALGFIVGDGWYVGHAGRYAWGSPPRRVMAQLELTYTDGSRQIIATHGDWRISRSPIQQSELDFGEIYDARLEQSGWDRAGFDDSSWQQAQLGASPPCRLSAHVSPPLRATQVLKPQAITMPLPGVYVFDFGQNFAGWCRLHVKGVAGTRVDLRFGEQLQTTGEIDQFVLLGLKAVDAYILRGDAAGETFEPHFTYHGFRYVQVTGLPRSPSTDSLEGIVVHTDLEPTGRLRVDHPMLQQLWRNIVWTQRSNFVSIPTDCPNRMERMSYGADTSIFWDAAIFNMDIAAFTRRQMDNVRDHQYPCGALPPLAPAPAVYCHIYRVADETTVPVWSEGPVILCWMSWRRYGDRRVIEQNWEAMNQHLQFILDRNPNYLWLNGRGPDLGDWLAIGDNHFMRPETPPSTPLDLLATSYWAYAADLVARMADVVQRPVDAERLRTVHGRVRSAFIERYVHADGVVGNGSQTSYILALQFRLVPEELRPRILELLVAEMRSRGTALSTGIVGTQFALDLLAEGGFADVVYDLLLRAEYPSWGYMIARGATTMWERWDGSLKQDHACASHNHYVLGSVGGFLFRRVAGIEEAEPGFRNIRVRPLLDARINRGGGDYDSVIGRISTDWAQTSDGRFTLEVTIPANAAAHIHLPARRDSRIEEGGEDVARRGDLRVIHRSDREAVIAAGSGTYRFVSVP